VHRLIVMNTALGTGNVTSGKGFTDWRAYSNSKPDMDIAARMARSTPRLKPQEAQAYAAPFPDIRYKAGVRRFPNLVPDNPNVDGAALSREARQWWSTQWDGPTFRPWACRTRCWERRQCSSFVGRSGDSRRRWNCRMPGISCWSMVKLLRRRPSRPLTLPERRPQVRSKPTRCAAAQREAGFGLLAVERHPACGDWRVTLSRWRAMTVTESPSCCCCPNLP